MLLSVIYSKFNSFVPPQMCDEMNLLRAGLDGLVFRNSARTN